MLSVFVLVTSVIRAMLAIYGRTFWLQLRNKPKHAADSVQKWADNNSVHKLLTMTQTCLSNKTRRRCTLHKSGNYKRFGEDEAGWRVYAACCQPPADEVAGNSSQWMTACTHTIH